ncbi:MAG TPA: LemA family protein [Acidiferrobacterales bacterium]|nr:LemA family protein [Acidiferrobacterales bacterium]
MAIGSFIVWGGIAVAVLYFIMIYNNLVRLKNNVSQAWSNIDVLLKQRHDELPKLIETCKQYMGYEKDVLQKVTQARAAVAQARETGNVRALGPAETQLRTTIGNLYAVAENYPELRANESFQNLQSRISQLEAQIADRREFYNDSVNTNNIRIEQFPDTMIARMLNFGARELLKFDKAELQDVNVKALFNS